MNKTENSTVKQSETVKSNINSNIAEQVVEVSDLQVSDNGQVAESTTEETQTVIYSSPDSTGRQWPTSTTKVKRTIVRNEKKNLEQTNAKSIEQLTSAKVIDKSVKKNDLDSTNTNKTREKENNLKTETKSVPWEFIIFVLLVLFVSLSFYIKKK
jgi:hypothetical protein